MSMSNPEYKSYFQTTTIEHNTGNGFIPTTNGFEMRPVCPIEIKENPIRIIKEGVIYIWHPSGFIERTSNNVRTYWFPKPTIEFAVKLNKDFHEDKKFFQFKSNGLVKAIYSNMEFIWYPEQNVNPIEGYPVIGRHCFCSNVIFENDPCDVCNNEDDDDFCGCKNNPSCCGYEPWHNDIYDR